MNGGTGGRAAAAGSRWLAIVPLAVGVVATVTYSLTTAKPVAALGTAGMLAAAAAAGGALLGFLFGIPRVLARDPGADGEAPLGAYAPNTNLEQISDWLTKIIIGVGLVEFGRILRAAGRGLDVVAPELGGGKAFSAGLVIYFVVYGFLLGWLTARIRLAPALSSADRAALDQFVRAEVVEARGNPEEAGRLRRSAAALASHTARRYEELRSTTPSTPGRTAEMETLIATARSAATGGQWQPEQVTDMFWRATDGDRIFVLGLMQGDVRLVDFDCAIDAVEHSRSAFEQYHALVVLDRDDLTFTAAQRTRLLSVLDYQMGPHGRVREGRERRKPATRIVDRLRPGTDPPGA
ncbi:hypothetical protein AB0J72_45450 [Dactylosporangium sp. NPDC049742]|uniref:hypothetical protein n=1 Tax=Dactylosporangium sp. NPDC049742 TaxID=3154737 RepID=UPI00344077C3